MRNAPHRAGHHNATSWGLVAILLWSTLASLTQFSRPIPPFELSAISFAIAFFAAFVVAWWQEDHLATHLRQPLTRWVVGLIGVPGNIVLYFIALRCTKGSPAGVNLVNYVWPLLIVVLSVIVLKESMGLWQCIGVTLGFGGAMLAIVGDGHIGVDSSYLFAYALAFGSAVCWAGYTIITRLMAPVSPHVIAIYCGSAVVPLWIGHILTEETVWPTMYSQWFAIVVMGLGPLGLAYYAWDYGMRFGQATVITAASFLIPVLSTLLLVVMGQAPFRQSIVLSCGLVAAGMALVSLCRPLLPKGHISGNTNVGGIDLK